MKFKQVKWRTILGLLIMITAVVMSWNWMWGILFLIWVIPDIFRGDTYFIEPIVRRSNPLLFWIIIVMWILMSAYFLVEPFFPQLYEKYYKWRHPSKVVLLEQDSRSADKSKVATLSIDEFNTNDNSETVSKSVASTECKDTLVFCHQRKQSFQVAGVSMLTTTFNDQIVNDMEELWDYFYKNDIHKYVPHKADDKIYLVFSDYDKPEVSALTVTLGYKLASNKGLHPELKVVSIPTLTYAIFEINNNIEENVTKTWNRIYESDLERANTFDLEVYSINASTLDLSKAEIWAGLKKEE